MQSHLIAPRHQAEECRSVIGSLESLSSDPRGPLVVGDAI
jgi:hypothetical protein